ncbi:hypothetical protein U2P60_13620 [Brucella sp. H1_1004]|uniref:hypothetical protein n=1 Tax=Brucella sp. H1_1004 TaxID=3110109 RepID=UPI0039B54D6B
MTPNAMLAYDNMEQTITEWALDYGLTPGIIIARLERGMTTADAITMPMLVGYCGQRLPIFHKKQLKRGERVKPKIARIQNIRLLTAFGQSMTLKEWADHIGVNEMTLRARLKRKSLEDALTMPKQSRAPKIKTQRPGVPSNFTPSKGPARGVLFKKARI